MTLVERLESYFGKKFVMFAPFIGYAASQGQWDTALQALFAYGGIETAQNIYSMKKNGKVSGDTAELVNTLKNLLKKDEGVPIPQETEEKATVDDSGANEAMPDVAEETPAAEEVAATIKPINIELVVDNIKKNLTADLVPIGPEIVSMKFHEWVLRNWDRIPAFDQARVLDYAIGLAREHYRIVVGVAAPATGEDMVNYNQYLASLQPQLTEKYGCGKYPAERVRVAVFDLRDLYIFKGSVSL